MANFQIPPGITFGNRILKIPHTSRVFDRAIWIQACLRDNPKEIKPNYQWVNRGETLFSFTILTSKTGSKFFDIFAGQNENEITIPAPASGIILHTSHFFGDNEPNGLHTAMLIPEDEPEALTGHSIFHSLCSFCWDYRDYIFFKPSEFEGRFNDENLRGAFEEQRSRNCTIHTAMPEYRDYLNEMRTRHPENRPYIKHLAEYIG